MRNLRRLGASRLGAVGTAAAGTLVVFGALAAATTTAQAQPVAATHVLTSKAPPPDVTAQGRTAPSARQECDVAYLRYGACYDYAGGSQTASNQGASATFPVDSPNLAWNSLGYHTLIEMAVFNRTATGIDNDTAEVGWLVQGLKPGQPPRAHLFVYHFVQTKGTCYDGCGFVSTSKTVKPGMAMKPGRYTWAIRNVGGRWTFYLNGAEFGYIPDSAYHGTFGHASIVNVFGELAEAGTKPNCTQLGNSLFSTQTSAATISGFRLYHATAAPDLTLYSPTDPAAWNSTSTPGGFRVGGPGDCKPMAATVATKSGYTVLGQDTSAYPFTQGQDVWARPAAQPTPQDPGAGQITGAASDPATGGYWMTDNQGDVYAVNAPDYGGLNGVQTPAPIVGITAFKSGYLLVDGKGNVYSFHAPNYGSATLPSPVVGITAIKDGYLIASRNGAVEGVVSTGGHVHTLAYPKATIPAPITGLAADGQGYLLVDAAGNVDSVNTPNHGSLHGTQLPEPIIGITPTGTGYLLTSAFGQVYAFATPFDGSVTNEGF